MTGLLDHAVKLVVVEYGVSLESVTNLNLHVMEKIVKARIIVLTQFHAVMPAVLVRS